MLRLVVFSLQRCWFTPTKAQFNSIQFTKGEGQASVAAHQHLADWKLLIVWSGLNLRPVRSKKE